MTLNLLQNAEMSESGAAKKKTLALYLIDKPMINWSCLAKCYWDFIDGFYFAFNLMKENDQMKSPEGLSSRSKLMWQSLMSFLSRTEI